MKISNQKTVLFLFSLSTCLFHTALTNIYAQSVLIDACGSTKVKNTLESKAQNIILEILFTIGKNNDYAEVKPDITNQIKSAKTNVPLNNEHKVIYYNPKFVDSLIQSDSHQRLTYVLFAHEISHLILGHNNQDEINSHELQADSLAGEIVGLIFDQSLFPGSQIKSFFPSLDRVNEFAKGWNKAQNKKDNKNHKVWGENMVRFKGNTFKMGDPFKEDSGSIDEKFEHSVSIASFYISKYEVSFKEFDEYIRSTNGNLPSDNKWGRDMMPVINVSWLDALNYCNWRSRKDGLQQVYSGCFPDSIIVDWSANGYRLPTEAEWEYAAKGGSSGQFRFSNGKKTANTQELIFSVGHTNLPYVEDNKSLFRNKPVPVNFVAGTPQINPEILHLSGNVYEWCWDRYAKYSDYVKDKYIPLNNPHGPSEGFCIDPETKEYKKGNCRVIRGGSYANDARDIKITARNHHFADGGGRDNIGFRLAMSAKE